MKKVVLITGCSSGLGLSAAKYLSKKHYAVVPAVRKTADLKIHSNATLIDVTWSQKKIDETVNKIVEKYGRIDCLINNAGYGYQGPIEDTNYEESLRQFETNFFGMAKMTWAVLPIMKKQKRGLMVNVSSILGLISVPKYGIYSASKFAIESFSKTLRIEQINNGVKVVIVNPGAFVTDFNSKSTFAVKGSEDTKGYGLEPIHFARTVEKIIETKNPKVRYIVAKEGLLVKAITILPEWISEILIQKYLWD